MKICAHHPRMEGFSLCGNSDSNAKGEDFKLANEVEQHVTCAACKQAVQEIHEVYTITGRIRKC